MRIKKTNVNVKKTEIPGLLIIERPTYPDERGFFHEIFRLNELNDAGVNFKPVQWSHSYSLPGVLRGIHTERWQKVIYPISGKMFGAYADIRPDSPTFKKVVIIRFDNSLKDSTHIALFVPPGVGNSMYIYPSEPVNFVYLVDEYWDDSKAQGIAWDDPDLAIKWPVKNPIISDRDKNNPRLRDLFPDKFK